MADEQDIAGELTGETAEMEKLLATFTPRAASINSAQLLYHAGREAAAAELAARGGVSRWLWPCATAAATILAATFGVLLAVRGEPEVHIVEKPVPIVTPVTVPQDDSDNAAADNPSPEKIHRESSNDSRVVTVPVSSSAQSLTTASNNRGSYLRTRDLILQHGFEAIPSFAPTRGVSREQTVSVHDLRKSLLPREVARPADAPRGNSIWPSFLLDGENL